MKGQIFLAFFNLAELNLSKLNRPIHRDIGYLITGLIIIYTLSGIALNHKYDWKSRLHCR
jgi:uncharacterized protein